MFISMYSDIKVFKFLNILFIDELNIEKSVNDWAYKNKVEITNTSLAMKDRYFIVIVVYKKKG
jgi:hypothetical protein